MGITVQAPRRFRDAHLSQQFCRSRQRRPPAHLQVQPQRFDELFADGEHRVEGGHRVLENTGDVPPAQRAQGCRGGLQQIPRHVAWRLPEDAALAAGVVRQQADDRHRRHAFS